METTVNRTRVEAFLRKQVGRFVGLDFVKQDGSERKLNGRLGVHKHLAGGSSTIDHSMPYLVVYDVKAPGYRAVNLETISRIRAQKHCIDVR